MALAAIEPTSSSSDNMCGPVARRWSDTRDESVALFFIFKLLDINRASDDDDRDDVFDVLALVGPGSGRFHRPSAELTTTTTAAVARGRIGGKKKSPEVE